MNLYYLAQKRDPNLVLTDQAALAVRRIGSDIWRGFDLSRSPTPQIRVRRATAWHPFRQRPETIGWLASSKNGGTLSMAFAPSGETGAVAAKDLRLTDTLSPLVLPWPLEDAPSRGDLDLLIHAPPNSQGGVFIAIHKALDRQPLLNLCKGKGIEIGPGPRPQILPSRDVEVSYVEQSSPEDWLRLYGIDAQIEVDPRLWDRYVVGEAHELPVEDGSLDFIFSSHVFEHLANPLGHLQTWSSKLKKGGKIVAIIPDYIGSKDYASAPSELRDLIAEYKIGSMEPTREHYAKFAHIRGITDGGAKMFSERRSIHVHYYSHGNMALLMEEAVRRFNFQNFSILHTPNHKDFHVVAIR